MPTAAVAVAAQHAEVAADVVGAAVVAAVAVDAAAVMRRRRSLQIR